MGRVSRPLLLVAILAVVASGCDVNGGAVESTTTTTVVTTTTTSPEPSTTTTAPNPCPDHPFCVIYEMRPGVVWSDGEPVTAADFAHTRDLMANTSSGRTGYTLITDVEAMSDTTVRIGFSRVFPAWRTLFDVVLPAHHEGAPDDPDAPVLGPFFLQEWIPGDRIVLSRNPGYWSELDPPSGEPTGNVDELVFVFPDSVRAQFDGLEDDQIDVVRPRPLDWMIEDLEGMEGVSFALEAGPFWDHIDFNHDDPLLSQEWVRDVISLAIDREAIMNDTVRTVDADAPALNSSVFVRGSRHYRANYHHIYDPESAEAILEERGCVLGDDGVYSCQGRRMSFVWATTTGDEYRETTFSLVRDGLAEIGVEVILDLRTPSDLFSSGVFFGGPEVWQIINFSWKAEPDPHLANSTFYCQGTAPSGYGALNVNRYCDDDVESLIRSTEEIIETRERMAAYNEADALYLGDRAIVPLYQKPTLLAWSSEITGPEPNLSGATDLWNVGAWRGKESVVVALGSEPDSLDPVSPDGESAEVVMSAMFHGAFSVDASLEFVPVIVSEATPIRGEG